MALTALKIDLFVGQFNLSLSIDRYVNTCLYTVKHQTDCCYNGSFNGSLASSHASLV